MPFLNEYRNDRVLDISKLSESATREYEIEERLKGANNTVVQVTLADTSGMGRENPKNRLEVKWVIRKRVPSKNLEKFCDRKAYSAIHPDEEITIDKKQRKTERSTVKQTEKRQRLPGVRADAAPKFVGDGNDSQKQQEANWRWQSTRYNPVSASRKLPKEFQQLGCLLSNFVGEVVRIKPRSNSSQSLAMVTLKRLILPEHTETGRMSHHGPNEIFVDGVESSSNYYQVPVEELVIISRRLNYNDSVQETKGMLLNVNGSYSVHLNTFVESSDVEASSGIRLNSKICCRCRRSNGSDSTLKIQDSYRCGQCMEIFKDIFQEKSGFQLDDEDSECDCQGCQKKMDPIQQTCFFNSVMTATRKIDSEIIQQRLFGDEFVNTRALLRAMSNNCDFRIVRDFLPQAEPSSKPVVCSIPSKSKKPKMFSSAENFVSDQTCRTVNGNSANAEDKIMETCSRLFPYNASTRIFEVSDRAMLSSNEISGFEEKPRNLRLLLDENLSRMGDSENDERFLDNRALRAKQRRLLRDVAAAGVSLDTLVGREQQLRFDRSKIHAWGVFADDDIKESEMIVEYRGEIIGNAVSEKREKEYEDAKIGSDYMFRIDSFSVCDATKQGNVARFINHSCEPNCFTKIISIDGNKRIAVYAKTAIPAGEELVYDYKFPLEYNEDKRIPCYCGANNCRGFMNWDKRYD